MFDFGILGKRIRATSGQAVMQALLAAAITGVIAMSSIAMLNRSKKAGSETTLVLKTKEVQKRLAELIRDDRAWTNTVAGNAAGVGMTCLQGSANCSTWGLAGAPRAFKLYQAESASTVFYDGTSATAGFTFDAAVCSTYSSGAGNNACPLHVALVWRPINRGSLAGCTNCGCNTTTCDAEITATFTYNPNTSQGDVRMALNTSTYQVQFLRESKTRQDYFFVVDGRKANNVGGGACSSTSGASNDRVLDTVVVDTGANITSTLALNNTAVPLKAGTYFCEITAPTGDVLQHQAYLSIPTGSPTSILGASSYYQAPSTISGRFVLAAPGSITVKHYVAGTAGNLASTSCLGRPANSGSNEIYTQLCCRRISQ